MSINLQELAGRVKNLRIKMICTNLALQPVPSYSPNGRGRNLFQIHFIDGLGLILHMQFFINMVYVLFYSVYCIL